MEKDLANLKLLNEEEKAFPEEATIVDRSYQFCLDLPPELMTETMAKQFGEFLGKFLEYDTSILTLGFKRFMGIHVRLDVSTLLKQKKKIQIGKEMTVYARFQYEKLCLFRLIYGKLGHGENYCPFHLWTEPANIVFGWDISLRAVVRQRNTVVSRWLCQADGSEWSNKNMKGNN
ncbi:hypothetical protein J1N35_037938 [Gossypium stocksii]|uniref:DUF4283 domain-containing protein n=1 Tax=Gossypium stocksii TaxID=47602 RepID=A0A9D3ULP8_9ROSI|nr:hypothetical protein J1N35_037938 [Gossypium stocksii]